MKLTKAFIALACALLTLVLPAAVQAKPNIVVKPKSLHLTAALPATNGYAASIRTSGHRQVVLTFSQGSYAIQYKTLGRVARTGVSADFGRFGSISLRFRGKRRVRVSRRDLSLLSHCKGRRRVEERGVFLGNVRFRGEHGFSRIKARRVKGAAARAYRQVCHGPSWLTANASRADYEGNILSATAGRNGVRRTFLALESSTELDGEPFGLAVEVATLEQTVEGVAISKSAFTLSEGVVRLDPEKRPVEVRVVAEWPFLGSAIYTGGSAPTWSGSLGARFPGSGQVSLAGPEFEVELCRTTDPFGLSRCAEKVLSRRPLYGSGSHSQPLALARLSSLR